jgi:hypothetical protein
LVLAAAWILSGPACARHVFSPVGPESVYLTWQGDPTTTITVQWLSGEGETGDEVVFGPVGGDRLRTAQGRHHPLPHSDRIVHVVELTGLDPGRDYRFRIAGQLKEHVFRTMPADAADPVSFIVGGDVFRARELDERMFRTAARQDAMFVVLGGDIVYDNGRANRVDRWYRLLDAWCRCMVAPDGRLIPLVAAIGNHEVHGRYDQPPQRAPFFYSLFAGIGRDGRQVLDFGDYMSVLLLDSGHTHPIDGEQAAWLERTLADRSEVPHLFVVYHVPAFPSARAFNSGRSRSVRRHWVPLFERYGVDVVFEHHDHAYKRTHRIKEGRIDPAGVLYLGDGGWGVRPRKVHSVKRTWYLARAESANNIIVTTVHRRNRRHAALNREGLVIDSHPQDSQRQTSDRPR